MPYGGLTSTTPLPGRRPPSSSSRRARRRGLHARQARSASWSWSTLAVSRTGYQTATRAEVPRPLEVLDQFDRPLQVCALLVRRVDKHEGAALRRQVVLLLQRSVSVAADGPRRTRTASRLSTSFACSASTAPPAAARRRRAERRRERRAGSVGGAPHADGARRRRARAAARRRRGARPAGGRGPSKAPSSPRAGTSPRPRAFLRAKGDSFSAIRSRAAREWCYVHVASAKTVLRRRREVEAEQRTGAARRLHCQDLVPCVRGARATELHVVFS